MIENASQMVENASQMQYKWSKNHANNWKSENQPTVSQPKMA
jgi:hypothetical protein